MNQLITLDNFIKRVHREVEEFKKVYETKKEIMPEIYTQQNILEDWNAHLTLYRMSVDDTTPDDPGKEQGHGIH